MATERANRPTEQRVLDMLTRIEREVEDYESTADDPAQVPPSAEEMARILAQHRGAAA